MYEIVCPSEREENNLENNTFSLNEVFLKFSHWLLLFYFTLNNKNKQNQLPYGLYTLSHMIQKLIRLTVLLNFFIILLGRNELKSIHLS